MNIVIMGCGRVGARVAALLDHTGNNVTIIDTDSRAFRRLPAGFGGETIIGTGIDDRGKVDRSAGCGLEDHVNIAPPGGGVIRDRIQYRDVDARSIIRVDVAVAVSVGRCERRGHDGGGCGNRESSRTRRVGPRSVAPFVGWECRDNFAQGEFAVRVEAENVRSG